MSHTIRVSDEVHAKLVKRAEYGGSLSQVIQRLIFMAEKWEEVGAALYHEHVTRERPLVDAKAKQTVKDLRPNPHIPTVFE